MLNRTILFLIFGGKEEVVPSRWGQNHKPHMVEEGGRSCNKNGEGATVKKQEKEADREICTGCNQPLTKLPDGKYRCGCQSAEDGGEKDPGLDLGYDIRGFV